MGKGLIESQNPYMLKIRGFLSILELQKANAKLKTEIKDLKQANLALVEGMKVMTGESDLKLKDINAEDFL